MDTQTVQTTFGCTSQAIILKATVVLTSYFDEITIAILY